MQTYCKPQGAANLLRAPRKGCKPIAGLATGSGAQRCLLELRPPKLSGKHLGKRSCPLYANLFALCSRFGIYPPTRIDGCLIRLGFKNPHLSDSLKGLSPLGRFGTCPLPAVKCPTFMAFCLQTSKTSTFTGLFANTVLSCSR